MITATAQEMAKASIDKKIKEYLVDKGSSMVSVVFDDGARDARDWLIENGHEDMLLSQGDTFSMYSDETYSQALEGSYQHYPNVGMYVNDGTTKMMDKGFISFWGNGWDYRDGSWYRELSLDFIWVKGGGADVAYERVVLSVSPTKFVLIGSVVTDAYWETGYEGHYFKSKHLTDVEAVKFLNMTKGLNIVRS